MTTVHLEYARYKGTWHELLEKVNAASPRYVYGELAWTWSAYEEIIQAQDEKEEPLPGIFLRFWDENLLSQLKGAIVSELLAFGSANDAFWRIIRRNRDTFAGIRIVEAENGAIQVSGEPQPVKLWEPERFPFADKIGLSSDHRIEQRRHTPH